MIKEFKTKGGGKKIKYNSGMDRETQINKPRFDLIIPKNQKYENTLFYRWAMLMERGARKYSERNWEKANSLEELERVKSSLWRHFMQAMTGEIDEDHFSAICFNLNMIVYLMDKLNVNINGEKNKNDK